MGKSRSLARSQLSLWNSFSGSNVASRGISQRPDGILEIESSYVLARDTLSRSSGWASLGTELIRRKKLRQLLMKKL